MKPLLHQDISGPSHKDKKEKKEVRQREAWRFRGAITMTPKKKRHGAHDRATSQGLVVQPACLKL